jgi:hypothetical protein
MNGHTGTVDDIADVRTGDKGNTLVVAAVVRDPADYDRLCAALVPDRVAQHFGALLTGDVQRTLLPHLGALVLILPGVLGGGVTGAPVLDGHGKALSYYVLTLPA